VTTTRELEVHPGNIDQLRAWDGPEGEYWASRADVFERSVAGYDDALFDAAGLRPTDRVLDVGCGTGSTSRRAARNAMRGGVLGVDLSSAMVSEARRRAEEEGLRNAEFLQADAQIHAFAPASFDVAISRTAAMFFSDRVAALANVRRALRPAGRLILLVWQPASRNAWFLELTRALADGRRRPTPPPDAPSPFALADPDVIAAVLSAAGYADVAIRGLEGRMYLGPDPEQAYDFTLGFLGWMLDGLDPVGKARACEAMRRTIEAHAGADGVSFGSAAWLVTARSQRASAG
jgi:SAM-dependent methyltransferase